MGLPVMQIYRGDEAQVQQNALACSKMWGGTESWAQFFPHVLLFSGSGLLSTPRLSISAQSLDTCSYCLACTFGTCLEKPDGVGVLYFIFFFFFLRSDLL